MTSPNFSSELSINPPADEIAELVVPLPDEIRERLGTIVHQQAQRLCRDMPVVTTHQLNQFKSQFWQQLNEALSAMLSQKITQQMQTPEFEKAMAAAIRSGRMPLLYSQQLGLAGEIVDQRLELFFTKYKQDLATICKLNAQERAKAQEERQQSIRAAKIASFEWGIAFSQWWRLLIAGAVGFVIASPIWMNHPALVGCDKSDVICTFLRVKQPKWVR
ncbi:MAG: hypothetical protein KME35_24335 [Aphanocapsa sp. GSE-SYN-MK-11-07L]|jgi:hypothetical protein|nr:hypothetical protein [Aphanocapsa sp. GSE-SYN-MK-11-07L]